MPGTVPAPDAADGALAVRTKTRRSSPRAGTFHAQRKKWHGRMAAATLAATDPMQPAEITFRSGESRGNLTVGFSTILLAATSYFPDDGGRAWLVDLLLVVAGMHFWLAWRRWRLPYVRVGGGRLVVLEGGKAKQVISLSAVKSVRRGFNSTRLELNDGTEASVSSLNFVSGEDVRRFRETLAGILAQQAATYPETV